MKFSGLVYTGHMRKCLDLATKYDPPHAQNFHSMIRPQLALQSCQIQHSNTTGLAEGFQESNHPLSPISHHPNFFWSAISVLQPFYIELKHGDLTWPCEKY